MVKGVDSLVEGVESLVEGVESLVEGVDPIRRRCVVQSGSFWIPDEGLFSLILVYTQAG